MRLLAAAVLTAVLAGGLFTLPATAQVRQAHINIKNDLSANGAWITVYLYSGYDQIVGSYCVPPKQLVPRTFPSAYKVIAEITKQSNCHGGTIKKLAQDIGDRNFNKTIRGSNGSFSW